MTTSASSRRTVGDLALFDTVSPSAWEAEYKSVMEHKYAKNTRNFSRREQGTPTARPQIYMIPRERGGPSFKKNALCGASPEDLHYALISKGYGMQNVSSFTLGPIPGEGLCLVNAAFSKTVCVMHIEGGGVLDYKRKSFWKPANKPLRAVTVLDDKYMSVDGVTVDTSAWLRRNENLWLDEWTRWSRSVALTSRGDFHWANGSPVVAYYHGDYLNFQEWKLACYIVPSFTLVPQTDVFKYLAKVFSEYSLGLVHPMASSSGPIAPVTKEGLLALIASETQMACQPYLVAAMLLGITLEEIKLKMCCRKSELQ